MDPLMSANLATNHLSAQRTQGRRPRREGDERLADGLEAWGNLAWSALPDAPVVDDPTRRTDVVRQRVATALRRAAARVDGGRPLTGVPTTRC